MIGSILEVLIRQQALWLGEQERFWRRMACVPRALQLARDTQVGTTPHEVVFQDGSLRLLRYRRETRAAFSEPVLFCYALVNRSYILDLQPDKSVVRQYLQRGFDAYMIDWGVPSRADRGLRLEDYLGGALKRVVDFVLREHRSERLHLLGYCMGGTMSAIFTALYPELIRTLTLLASPIDFADRESLANLWADEKYFDVDAFVDTHGNCPAAFLQACFLFMRPVQNLIEKQLAFWDRIEDPRFIASYFAMEQWVNDNIPVAGETFREFVRRFYQRNELVRGEFCLGPRPVDLRRIRCPLLLLTAKNDHLVVPESTNGIRPHTRSRDVKATTIDAGHVGLVVSGKAQREFWPEATRWLAERSVKRVETTAGESERSLSPRSAAEDAPCAQLAAAKPSYDMHPAVSDARGEAHGHRQEFACLPAEQGTERQIGHDADPAASPIGDPPACD
ncbi:MAG TPA: class III poly(R)-hydroxyalkanoic acid synthase subunit PhaC [Polyangiaceae bacterium]|nr:class III poly(R)-hydroxyalkanoic acid synthase subunit PhaC [Polyangiaceae bacterium]